MSIIIRPQRLGKYPQETTGYLHTAADKSSIQILASQWLGTQVILHRAIQNIGARQQGNEVKNQKPASSLLLSSGFGKLDNCVVKDAFCNTKKPEQKTQ